MFVERFVLNRKSRSRKKKMGVTVFGFEIQAFKEVFTVAMVTYYVTILAVPYYRGSGQQQFLSESFIS